MKCCPKCGQTLPDPAPFMGLRIRGAQLVILNAVLAAGPNGIASERLVDAVYGNAIDTPDDEAGVLRVHICTVNRKLKKVRYRIHNPERGAGIRAVYRMIKL